MEFEHPWLANHRAIVTAILLAAHALTFALSFPPTNLWFMMPVSIVLITVAAVGARRMRTLIVLALMALFVMWMVMMNWVYAVTFAGYPFMCIGMSAFGVGYAMSLRALSRARKLERWPFAILVPVAWTAFEAFRGEIAFHGYPWYFAAHPFAALPAWIQSADLFGTYFLSFLVAMAAGAIVDIIRAWRHGISLAGRVTLFLVGVFISLNLGYGYYRLNDSSALSLGPRIAAIQTNLPQENKIGWGKEQWERDVPTFFALSRGAMRAANEELGGADLLVWPETMLPGPGFDPEMMRELLDVGPNAEALLRWPSELLALRDELDLPMLVGSGAWLDPTWVPEGDQRRLTIGRSFNSAYLVTDQPPFARYDKYFLTPFGETMPYISAWPWLEEKLLAIGARGMSFDLDKGSDLAPLAFMFEHDGAMKTIHIGTPICFEDSVPWVCRGMMYEAGAKRGDMLINISNDGWFGLSDGSRAHHLQIARFRAIENRVPIVRSVNTGFSASIDSCGRIVAVVGEGFTGSPRRDGWLVTQVMLDRRNTLYGTIGDLWADACLIAFAGMLLGAWFLRKGGRSS